MSNKLNFANMKPESISIISAYSKARHDYYNVSGLDDNAKKTWRARCTREMNTAIFAFLASDEERAEVEKRNANRTASAKVVIGTAHNIPDLFADALNDVARTDSLVREFKDIMIKHGIADASESEEKTFNAVAKTAKAMLAYVSATRYNAKKDELTTCGARTIDKAVMNAFVHVAVKMNKAFDVADDGTVTLHDFTKDAEKKEG